MYGSSVYTGRSDTSSSEWVSSAYTDTSYIKLPIAHLAPYIVSDLEYVKGLETESITVDTVPFESMVENKLYSFLANQVGLSAKTK